MSSGNTIEIQVYWDFFLPSSVALFYTSYAVPHIKYQIFPLTRQLGSAPNWDSYGICNSDFPSFKKVYCMTLILICSFLYMCLPS